MNKLSKQAKDAQEFENLATQSMTDKEKKAYAKELKKEMPMLTCGDMLKAMGQANHSFLVNRQELQLTGQEYQQFNSVDISKWTAKEKQAHRKEKQIYHDRLKKIYKDQHTSNIIIETYHDELIKRIGYHFELSHLNLPMIMSVVYDCIMYDLKKLRG